MFHNKKFLDFLLFPDKLLAETFIILIRVYQKTISPDHSALGKLDPFCGCKFYPSCSEYAILSLQKKGFFRSLFKISWRILRCHPWSHGGVDFP